MLPTERLQRLLAFLPAILLAALVAACGLPKYKGPERPPTVWNPSADKAAREVCRAKMAAGTGKVGPVTPVIGGRIPNRGAVRFPTPGIKKVREKDLRMYTVTVENTGLAQLLTLTHICFFEDTGSEFRFIQTCVTTAGRLGNCDLTWLVG